MKKSIKKNYKIALMARLPNEKKSITYMYVIIIPHLIKGIVVYIAVVNFLLLLYCSGTN